MSFDHSRIGVCKVLCDDEQGAPAMIERLAHECRSEWTSRGRDLRGRTPSLEDDAGATCPKSPGAVRPDPRGYAAHVKIEPPTRTISLH